ncbi:MAG TPA: HlyD family secretion protein [Stellaceae bacterium]|jgi:membrane fusion protein (multidrug efflux system)|nr:HlyD family secretion protein [Stellaceae bacterium]
MNSVVLPRVATTLPGRNLARLTRKQLAVSGLAALLAIGAADYGWHWWTVGRFVESTDDAYVGGNVTALSPHVAGFVSRILVGDNEFVKAGQTVIELDDRDYRAKLAHAEAAVRHETANVANLRAQYALQQSTITQAEANLNAARATAGFAREEASRYRQLAATSYGSLQNDQKASAADRQAQASVIAAGAAAAAARQKLAVIDTETAAAQASLAQAQADLSSAQLDLGYTKIRTPIDGYVGARAAQVGAYVTSSNTLLSIVPAHGLWVDANFKEDQLARMRADQSAKIVADVLPGRSFHGRVLSLAPATGAVFAVIPPENATGNFTKIVQRVPVRIAIADSDGTLGALRPGLSVTATIDTKAGDPTAGGTRTAGDGK